MKKRWHKILIYLGGILELIRLPNCKINNYSLPWHKFTQREQTLLNIFSNLNHEIDTFLNVGFHDWQDSRNQWWVKFCKVNKINWNIIEIFLPNVKRAIAAGCPKDKIIHADFLDTKAYNNYDCILHWHGPEHIDKKIFLDNLPSIENKANKLLIFGMPLGEEIQGAQYGNKYEEHISSWEEIDWKNLGYSTMIVNDRSPGHITAYKIIK